MALLSPVLRSLDGGRLMFRCPGCNENHQVTVAGPNPVWGWNGNVERPTFTPSVLIRSGHYCLGEQGKGRDCWCTFEARTGRKPPFHCYLCHSFVTDGMIQFLGDCTHALAGQTVPLACFAVEPEG